MNIDAITVSIGRSIRRMRQRKKLSQAQLARAVGVSNVFVCNVENGHSLPSTRTLMAMLEAVGGQFVITEGSEP